MWSSEEVAKSAKFWGLVQPGVLFRVFGWLCLGCLFCWGVWFVYFVFVQVGGCLFSTVFFNGFSFGLFLFGSFFNWFSDVLRAVGSFGWRDF